MESSVSTIVCPNCGANPQNHNNCEYCGSLLVRFADKNIPLNEEKYGSKAFTFEGLKEALTKNLEEQARTSGHNHVHTKIKCWPLVQELDVTNPKAQTELVLYKLSNYGTVRIKPTNIPETDEQSLVICIRFYEVDSKFSGLREERQQQVRAHNRFKQMDIFNLFSLQLDTLGDKKGFKLGTVYQYYLNFGRDVDGAAAIITQYFLHNCKVSSERLKMSYEHSSLTEEEYSNLVIKAMRGSKFYSSFTAIMGIILVLVGILSFIFLSEEISEDVSLLLGALLLPLIGVFLIIYSFRSLNH